MDWTLPTVNDMWANIVAYLKNRDTDLAKGLDPAKVTVTTPATDFIRWNSASGKWQIYSGTVWGDLASSFDINVTTLGGSVAAAYALLASPAFTGNPTVPTQSAGNNTTRAASTAFVTGAISTLTSAVAAAYAPLTGAGTSGTWGISISGTAALATSIAGGLGGQVLYQSAAGATAKLANGTAGYLLSAGGGTSAPAWLNPASITAGLASNVTGGLGGQLLYQSAADTTSKLANGTAGYILTAGGTTVAPSWANPTGITIGKATNIAGGAGGQIPYQSAADTTALLANGTAGQVLTSAGGTSAPTWASPIRKYSGVGSAQNFTANASHTWSHGLATLDIMVTWWMKNISGLTKQGFAANTIVQMMAIIPPSNYGGQPIIIDANNLAWQQGPATNIAGFDSTGAAANFAAADWAIFPVVVG